MGRSGDQIVDLAKTADALEKIAHELTVGASGWMIAPLIEQAWDRAIVGADIADKDAWLVAQGVIFGAIYAEDQPSSKELVAYLKNVSKSMRIATEQGNNGGVS